MRVTGFFQCTPDKTDIVGRTAAASGLRDNDRGFIHIVFSGRYSIHDLSDHHKGRVAGIVVDIFQSDVYRRTIVVVQYNEVVTAGSKRRFQQFEMNRRHLRTEDSIIFTHFFGKYRAFKIRRLYLAFFWMLFPYADRSQQGADTDSGRTQIVDLVDFQTGINLAGPG